MLRSVTSNKRKLLTSDQFRGSEGCTTPQSFAAVPQSRDLLSDQYVLALLSYWATEHFACNLQAAQWSVPLGSTEQLSILHEALVYSTRHWALMARCVQLKFWVQVQHRELFYLHVTVLVCTLSLYLRKPTNKKINTRSLILLPLDLYS